MTQITKKGFTIIELLLAMTLVAILLLSVALMTVQITNLSIRGNTLIEINTAGRAINDEFTRTFNSSSAIPSWDSHPAKIGADQTLVEYNGGGAFCSGKYSYLWNTAEVLRNSNRSNSEVPIRYAGSAVRDNSIRLIRVNDTDKAYCSNSALWTQIPRTQETREVLAPGENDLMIHSMAFKFETENILTNQTIISISYKVGTRDAGTSNINMSGCDPKDKDAAYCALNRFDIVVRTLGR